MPAAVEVYLFALSPRPCHQQIAITCSIHLPALSEPHNFRKNNGKVSA
jgi:hypothetical protein